MVTINRILVPVDFSDVSREALRHAAAFAQWYCARLTALYVVSPLFLPVLMVSAKDLVRTSVRSSVGHEALEKELRTFLQAAGIDDTTVDVVIEEGDPARRILDHAASLEDGLIVIGTHGRGGFDRLVLGSVAEKVLRKARCPVLTVPPAAIATSTLPLKRLLCAIDFSGPSLSAFEFALSIAQESAAHLTLLHVVQWPEGDTDSLVEIAPDILTFRRDFEDKARRRLEQLITEDVKNWCEPTCRLAHGTPYERILDVAAEERTDLIVMGTHGRSAVDHLLFGSTTNQVVRQARSPVLTLRR